jgi:nucleoside-triphosphatase THEP1
MTQCDALDILKTGCNVFLTGEPGSGKTYTINQFVAYLRASGIEPAITASTGIAATHIHGMTLHSWSGIGVMRDMRDEDIADLAKSRYISMRIKKTKVLIVDEISMIDGEMLSNVERVCRRIKKSAQPFGGMQVVFVGDFFQLPPVQKNKQKRSVRDETSVSVFSFASPVWRMTQPIVCYLTEQHRQEDAHFLDILSAMRRDEFSETQFERMRDCLRTLDEVPSDMTRLFSHNMDVDSINTKELQKLSGKTRSFLMADRGPERLVEALKRGCLSPERLELKEGAAVMFTKNNPNVGFVNGTLGTIIGWDEESRCPVVMTHDEVVIVAKPMEWAIEEQGEVLAKIMQIPLRLAWAMTIHKSQGMSLDAAVMDLSKTFEFGQGYVALSRVRNLAGVHLLGVNEQAFRVSPEILVQDKIFREQSQMIEEEFVQLPWKERVKRQKDFIKMCGGRWSETLEKITHPKKDKETSVKKPPTKTLSELREKNPKAYAKWDNAQEDRLRALFGEGLPSAEIADMMERQIGGIRSRLKKLGLIVQ